MPTLFSLISSESPGFFLDEYGFAITITDRYAIYGFSLSGGDVALAHVFEHVIHRATEGITEPAPARSFDPHDIILVQSVVAKP